MIKETQPRHIEQANLELYNPTKAFIPKFTSVLARIDSINSKRLEAGMSSVIDPVEFTKRALLKNRETLSQNVISILDVFCMDAPIERSPSQIQVYNYLDRVTGGRDLANDDEISFKNAYKESRVNLGYFLNYAYLKKQAETVAATARSYANGLREEAGKMPSSKEQALEAWTDLRLQFRAENNLKNELIQTKNGVFNMNDSLSESEKEAELKTHMVTDAKEEIYSSRHDERVRRSQKLAGLTQSLTNISFKESSELVVEAFLNDDERKEISKIRGEHGLALRLAKEVTGFTSYKQESYRQFRDKFIDKGIMRPDVIPCVEKQFDRVAEIILGSSLENLTYRTKQELLKSTVETPDGKRIDALSALRNYVNGVAAHLLLNPQSKQQ